MNTHRHAAVRFLSIIMVYGLFFGGILRGQSPPTSVIRFSNLEPGIVDAPFYDATGTNRLGLAGHFRAALYVGSPRTPVRDFAPVTDGAQQAQQIQQSFLAGPSAGYWVPTNVIVPYPGGSNILAQVRVWDSEGGTIANFEAAEAAGASFAISRAILLTLALPSPPYTNRNYLRG